MTQKPRLDIVPKNGIGHLLTFVYIVAKDYVVIVEPNAEEIGIPPVVDRTI